MPDYTDLGFDSFLQRPLNPSDLTGYGRLNIEGMDLGSLATVGRLQSADGNFFIDFENGEVQLPRENVKSRNVSYPQRAFKAIVSQTGDGDFLDINDAIDYVSRQGGGNILVKGTYTPTEDIKLEFGVSLIGFSKDQTVIDFDGSPYGIVCPYLYSKIMRDWGTVGDSESDLNSDGTVNLTDLSIYLYSIASDTNPFVIENMTIKNSTSNAIHLSHLKNSHIRNCLFSNNFVDIRVEKVEMCVIEANWSVESDTFVSASGEQTPNTNGNCFINVRNNKVENCTDVGIYANSADVFPIVINNNVFKDSEGDMVTAIKTYDTYGSIRVENNTISGGSSSIVVEEGSKGSIVSKNTIIPASSGNGIVLQSGNFLNVEGNLVNGANSITRGIWAASVGVCEDGEIRGNIITDGTTGILLSANSHRMLVAHNHVHNATTPISNLGVSNQLSHNHGDSTHGT